MADDLTADLVPDGGSPARPSAVRIVAIDLTVWQWAVLLTKATLGSLLVSLIIAVVAGGLGLIGTLLFSALGIAALFAGGGG
jgi:hypothetical protein